MSIKDDIKIRSIRESVGKEYVKPDPEKIKSQVNALWSNEDALTYLTDERGLAARTIKHFKLGYDYERNAISIPIQKNGEVVAIKYRNLKPKGAKYGAEANCESWLFNEDGLHEAKNTGTVIVVEGEFDLMCAWQAGHKNIISPAQGKNSYTVWIEKLDSIPKIIIAYDNDAPGKEEGLVFADKVGMEKAYELKYPEGIKDANEFFLKNEAKAYQKLIDDASPFYTYQFKGLGEVIKQIRDVKIDYTEFYCIPEVKVEDDWLIVVSGVTNVGKTSYAMNIAKEMADKDSPVLIMPFERGIRSVGQRYLQLELNMTKDKIENQSSSEWTEQLDKVMDKPVFFSLPKKEELEETIKKAQRLFGVKAVVIDHLDYLVRNVTGNKEQDIGQTLHELKRIAIERKIMMFVVTHIKKQDTKGSIKPKAPVLEDLKGSSSLYQDPECVLLLHADNLSSMYVKVAKNKGPMVEKEYGVDVTTGKMSEPYDF
jgi:DNA primase